MLTGALAFTASIGATAEAPDGTLLGYDSRNTRLVSVQLREMAGGGSIHQAFLVRRTPGTEGGRFAFALEDVEDYESDCNDAERSAGDRTCGVDLRAGEMSTQLAVRSAWTAPRVECPGDAESSPAVSLADMDGGVVTAPTGLSDGDAACLVLVFELPTSADNMVQSDHVHFDIRLGVVDATAIAAPSVEIGPATLPFQDEERATGKPPSTGDGVSVQATAAFTADHTAAVLSAVLAILAALAGLFVYWRRRV